VLAAPVAPPGWQARIGAEADELVCVRTPPGFFAIAQYYASFPPVTDDEVIACLRQATEVQRRASRPDGDPPGR
jgi:predicted phosphoribosyltransferase